MTAHVCVKLVCLVLVAASPYCVYVYSIVLASHIDTTVLADGTYELIPESEGSDPKVQVNTTVLTEDPD